MSKRLLAVVVCNTGGTVTHIGGNGTMTMRAGDYLRVYDDGSFTLTYMPPPGALANGGLERHNTQRDAYIKELG